MPGQKQKNGGMRGERETETITFSNFNLSAEICSVGPPHTGRFREFFNLNPDMNSIALKRLIAQLFQSDSDFLNPTNFESSSWSVLP